MGRAHEVRAASMAKTAAKKSKLYSRFGKELYIEGGFSGVLTYIAQNCTLIHE